ncbi:MAG: hypothetical protein IH994_05980 [Proteobacteria bacterium]|nr:hypothetical protein [Pseudomonadota bacterium]
MDSLPLKKTIKLIVDGRAFSHEPYRKRELAEEVIRLEPSERWSIGDRRTSELRFVMQGITQYMSDPISEAELKRFVSIPGEYRASLGELPRAICISVHGGKNSLWISIFTARPEHFDATLELRDYVIRRTQESRDSLQEAKDIIRRLDVGCLLDLLSKTTGAATATAPSNQAFTSPAHG